MTFMLINQDLEALAVNSRSPGRMPTLEVAVGAGVGLGWAGKSLCLSRSVPLTCWCQQCGLRSINCVSELLGTCDMYNRQHRCYKGLSTAMVRL